jgi:two-component system sensor histidine kinase/response regulator
VLVTPLRVALAYLVFGLGWIFATDLALVALGDSSGVILWASLSKGTLFVIASAAVVYLLVWREVREQIRTAKLLQAVVEGTTDAVFVKDRQGVYLFCNTAAAQLVARTPAEVIGHTDADWFDPSSYQLIRKREMQVMQQGQATTAEETLTAGGVTRTFHAVKAPYRDADGNILGVVGISRDISERAKLLARIREQESLLREAGELARIGGWAFAPDSDQGQWTDVVAQILEVDYQTFQLAQFLQFLSGDSRARFEATLQAARQGGLTFDLELQVQTARGASLWVRMIGKAVREEGHPLLIRGCIQDITAQKKLQQELRDNEARIRTLGDNLPDGGLYRYRRWPDGRKIFEFVSRGIEQIFGVTATELQQDALALHRLIDPEDAIRLDAAERESMANRSVFDCEFRSWTRNGQLRWFHCRSSPTPQTDGSTVWDGIIIDITARRLAESRLHQLSVAVEQCPVSIVITDSDWRD